MNFSTVWGQCRNGELGTTRGNCHTLLQRHIRQQKKTKIGGLSVNKAFRLWVSTNAKAVGFSSHFFPMSATCFSKTNPSKRRTAETHLRCITHPYTVSFPLSYLSQHTRWLRMHHNETSIFWLHTANKGHTRVNACHSCAQDASQVKHKLLFQQCPVAGLLWFVAIKILGSLPKSTSGNQFRVIITNVIPRSPLRFSPGELHPCTLRLFLDHWILRYGISYVMTDKGL